MFDSLLYEAFLVNIACIRSSENGGEKHQLESEGQALNMRSLLYTAHPFVRLLQALIPAPCLEIYHTCFRTLNTRDDLSPTAKTSSSRVKKWKVGKWKRNEKRGEGRLEKRLTSSIIYTHIKLNCYPMLSNVVQ